MADISLLFDVEGGGALNGASGKEIKAQLDSIVSQINATPLKIKFQADETSLNHIKDTVRKITDSLGTTQPRGRTNTSAAKEQERATREAERATKAALSTEKEYQSVLGRVQQALRNYTAAKNSHNASSREAYQALANEEVALRQVFDDVRNGRASYKDLKAAIDKANVAFTSNSNIIKAAGDNTKNFFDRMGGLASKFSAWFGITRIIMATVRTVKQMVSASIELESAFAQLKIITNATDEEMSKFADTAVRLAKNLGQSVTDVTKSIETFSRLGYNLADAASLAEYSTILSNVAAVDASEATTGLTSIIKGFNMDVTNAEHVADVLVNVGQKYAVSASEMMTAYEKSGAALNATNTSFEKSAGLIAAANASVECCRAA